MQKVFNYVQLLYLPISTKETKKFIDDISREVYERAEKLAVAKEMAKQVPKAETMKRDIWFEALVHYSESQERAIRRLKLLLTRVGNHVPHDGRPIRYEVEQRGKIPMWKATFDMNGQEVVYILGTVVDAP